MSVWMVVWVVLMMMWFFAGSYWSYNGPTPNPMNWGASCLIPFLCVLLLGLMYFGAISPGVPVQQPPPPASVR